MLSEKSLLKGYVQCDSVHIIFSKGQNYNNRELTCGRGQEWGGCDHKGEAQGAFWGDEIILYPDCGDGYMDPYVCSNLQKCTTTTKLIILYDNFKDKIINILVTDVTNIKILEFFYVNIVAIDGCLTLLSILSFHFPHSAKPTIKLSSSLLCSETSFNPMLDEEDFVQKIGSAKDSYKML